MKTDIEEQREHPTIKEIALELSMQRYNVMIQGDELYVQKINTPYHTLHIEIPQQEDTTWKILIEDVVKKGTIKALKGNIGYVVKFDDFEETIPKEEQIEDITTTVEEIIRRKEEERKRKMIMKCLEKHIDGTNRV